MKRPLIPLIILLSMLAALVQAQGTAIGATVQYFQHGFMIWRADTGSITVYYDTQDGGGHMQTYPSTAYGRLSDNRVRETPPRGMQRPIMGFGRVWGNMPNVRTLLGWATGGERGFLLTPISASGGSIVFNLPDGEWIWQYNRAWRVTSAPAPTAACIVGVGGYNSCSTFPPLPTATPDPGCSMTGGGTLPRCPIPTAIPTSDCRVASNRTTTYAAWQPFEYGFMLWFQNSETVQVFVNGGSISTYPISSYGGLPDNPVRDTPPQDRVMPIRGFGRVWGNFTSVRSALGWATMGEQGYNAALATTPNGASLITLPFGATIEIGSARWDYVTLCP
jgi:hypothetical protein